MTGIIDIGSNTVRLVMYDNGKKIFNRGLNSEIIKDTENGMLSEKGTEKLCTQLSVLKEIAGENRVFAFATYAMRVLKNKEQVRNTVYKNTGIKIDILSGEQEAEYDYIGLKNNLKNNESGVGVDLGGGSGQIMFFENGELTFSSSYPIGCRRVKNELACSVFPNRAESERIKKYIKEQLKDIPAKKSGKLYMMGGTAKTAAKLNSYLKGNENVNIIKTSDLRGLVEFISETPEDVIKHILKNRYDNISVGIIIMEEIAKILNVEEIHIKKCGVRDGYLYKNM